MTHRSGLLAAVMTTALLLAACAGDASLPDELVASADTVAPVTALSVPDCTDAQQAVAANTATYPPLDPLPGPDALPAGSTMAKIKRNGRLRVGVSGDTLLFGSRDPFSTEIEGFDIDILKQVAIAIFGPDGADRIEYKVITYGDRLPKLIADEVDIVAHTMTINCRRWQLIAFSEVYFLSGQRVLVNKGSGFTSVQDLVKAGATVCAPNASTNIDEINKAEYRGIVVIGKDDTSDCLVAMQQGEADAATGDDTVLAGFAAQDPNTEVVGNAFTDEPYGLGINLANTDFVQFVNAVLEQIRADGTYDAIVQKWLVDTNALENVKPVPAPDYTRPVPVPS